MAEVKKKVARKKKATAKKPAAKKPAAKKPAAKKSSSGPVLSDIIQNWNKMNESLNTLTEEQCLELLQLEQSGRRRVHMLNRIHARFTKLRSERERIDIMSGKDIAA